MYSSSILHLESHDSLRGAHKPSKLLWSITCTKVEGAGIVSKPRISETSLRASPIPKSTAEISLSLSPVVKLLAFYFTAKAKLF